MMQPMGGAPQMAPQQQYLSQQQQQPPQQWMASPQQPPQQYQVPPPQQQQQPSAAYYYQQHTQQQQQPQQQYSSVAGADSQQSDGVRNLWVGDLLYWMDEQYLLSCFAHTGEVLSAKVIRNKLNSQSEGYGFLEFNSHAAAERTLQTYNGSLMPNSDQNFRLNWASMGAGEKRADDSSDYSVFVGDLAGDVTDFILQETFRAVYPSVKGAKVVTDRLTGRTKGYGFVKFADESEQQRAMIEMNGRFCSTRPMRVGPASKKSSMDGGQPRGASYQVTQGTSEEDPTNTTLFVGNLDTSVAEEHLRHVFGQYGQLIHVKIPVGKRCGFVQFADRISAEEALRELNGTVFGGQNVRLSWGHSPSNKQPQADQSQWNSGGGGGGGYYGYGAAAGGGGGGYDGYGYGGQAAAAAAQDPSMYYQGYPGYGNYAAQTQHQQPPQVFPDMYQRGAHAP